MMFFKNFKLARKELFIDNTINLKLYFQYFLP